jgi:hypothetical protein
VERKILAVDGHAQVVGHAGIPAGRLLDGLFNGAQNELAVNAALTLDIGHDRLQIVIHGYLFSLLFLSKIKKPHGDLAQATVKTVK